MRKRTRYITKKVRKELLHESRDRCCICRDKIIPGGFNPKRYRKILQKHHIDFISEGGSNLADNLIVVCANHHQEIHCDKDRSIWTDDKLTHFKIHWIKMTELVSSQLVYNSNQDDEFYNNTIILSFFIASLNLTFSIRISENSYVSELEEFIRSNVTLPLGVYDKNDHWTSANKISLSFQSSSNVSLDSTKRFYEISFPADKTLIASFKTNVQFIMKRPYIINQDMFMQIISDDILQQLKSTLLDEIKLCVKNWGKPDRGMIHIEGKPLLKLFKKSITDAAFRVRDTQKDEVKNERNLDEFTAQIISAAGQIELSVIHKLLPPKVVFESGYDIPKEITDALLTYITDNLSKNA